MALPARVVTSLEGFLTNGITAVVGSVFIVSFGQLSEMLIKLVSLMADLLSCVVLLVFKGSGL